MERALDDAYAGLLQRALKGSRGSAPELGMVKAAIVLARDPTIGLRAACRAAGVNPSSAATCAQKVKPLLAAADSRFETSSTSDSDSEIEVHGHAGNYPIARP